MSGVARPGSRSNACAGTSYARANLAGAGDVWGLVPPAVFKNAGGGLLEPCRLSSRVASLFVGLTARIEAREAGDERGLVSSAVFKTVCGALLRRPGWVRFPSIPATFCRADSQVDSHSNGRSRTLASAVGMLGTHGSDFLAA